MINVNEKLRLLQTIYELTSVIDKTNTLRVELPMPLNDITNKALKEQCDLLKLLSEKLSDG